MIWELGQEPDGNGAEEDFTWTLTYDDTLIFN